MAKGGQYVAHKGAVPTPAPIPPHWEHLPDSTEMSLAAEAEAVESVEEFRS